MPIERVTKDRNQANLPEDLQKYCQEALKLGADEARVVDVLEIPVEEAVAFKCRVPRCFGYDTCAQCPPHAPKPAEIRQLLKSYSQGLFFVRRVNSEILKRDRNDKERKAAFLSILEIVCKLESAAFYDGHYLAVGFCAGSCFSSICDPNLGCQVLKGETCRFPLKARPSMEAVGIDVYGLIAASGWEVYPFGCSANPKDIPVANLAGLVLIQ
jgi:predicted metal-binding protein